MAFDQIQPQILRNYRHTELKLSVFDLYSQKVVVNQFLASLEARLGMRMVIFGTDTLTLETTTMFCHVLKEYCSRCGK